MNFNDQEQKEKKYTHDPDGPFVRSEEVKKESGTDTTTATPAVREPTPTSRNTRKLTTRGRSRLMTKAASSGTMR